MGICKVPGRPWPRAPQQDGRGCRKCRNSRTTWGGKGELLFCALLPAIRKICMDFAYESNRDRHCHRHSRAAPYLKVYYNYHFVANWLTLTIPLTAQVCLLVTARFINFIGVIYSRILSLPIGISDGTDNVCIVHSKTLMLTSELNGKFSELGDGYFFGEELVNNKLLEFRRRNCENDSVS